jgi:hypothetical protein
MFQLPVEENELDDRIESGSSRLVLRTYGLPMVFWGYLAAILVVLGFMILAIKGPLRTILASDDAINHGLAYTVIAIFILVPVILLGFYFYEKEVIKEGSSLVIRHKVFFIPLKKTIIVAPFELELIHFLDSPNMAKAKQQQGMKGFENRGYFQVFAIKEGRRILVDRNSRKAEMSKLIALLNKYPQ